MLKGFREFILRGNVVDLGIAVVIGAAFGTLVKAFVDDILTPLIGALGVKGNFGDQSFDLNGSKVHWGDFVNAGISFALVAAAVYFAVVVPMNHIAELRARGVAPEAPGTRACPECLSDIPVAARRCAHCTAAVGPSA